MVAVTSVVSAQFPLLRVFPMRWQDLPLRYVVCQIPAGWSLATPRDKKPSPRRLDQVNGRKNDRKPNSLFTLSISADSRSWIPGAYYTSA